MNLGCCKTAISHIFVWAIHYLEAVHRRWKALVLKKSMWSHTHKHTNAQTSTKCISWGAHTHANAAHDQYKVYTWIRCTELHQQVFATAQWFIHFPFLCHSRLVMQQFNTNQRVSAFLVSIPRPVVFMGCKKTKCSAAWWRGLDFITCIELYPARLSRVKQRTVKTKKRKTCTGTS